MKNKLSRVLIVVLPIFVMASCHEKTQELTRYIPKDASTVFVVDTKAITDKINASGITLDSLANLFDEKNKEEKWNDIKNSGINLEKSIYVFSKSSNSMQAGKKTSFGFVAAVKDKTKLEAFLKKQSGGAGVQAADTYQYLRLNESSVAGWNDNVVIITGESNNTGDSSSQQLLKNSFTLSESNSVASVEAFNAMLSKKADMHFWSTPSDNLSALPMLGMTKINQLIEGSYTEGTINFEKGKAVFDMSAHYNKTLSDILQKYPSKEIKKDMVANFPGAVSGFAVFSFNPDVLIDILHFLGFDAMADNYAAQMGFTTTDVLHAISGDVAFIYAPKSTAGNSIHGSDFLVNFAIGDKAAFDKVMAGLVNKNVLSKNGNQYQLGMYGGHGFVIETSHDALLIASGDDLAKSYIAGNNKASLPADIDKEMSGKSMAVYIDINSLMDQARFADTGRRRVAEMAKSTFKDFIITADKSDGKTGSGLFELNFVNQDENSLASLVKFMAAVQQEDLIREHNGTLPPEFPGTDSDSSGDQPH